MTRFEILATDRLVLRRPEQQDAAAIFERYANDTEVTRYLCWPRHRSLADTERFLDSSEQVWQRWPMGPYLIESREHGHLLGSVGLTWETPYRAAVGYVLARDTWGQGYASEALGGVLQALRDTELRRLYALCHHKHHVSARVLDKCGFVLEGTLKCHTVFPNLGRSEPSDVLCYALTMK